jgi:hypothetical protein
MTRSTAYTSQVAIPLPSDEAMRLNRPNRYLQSAKPDKRHFRGYPVTGHAADMPNSARKTRTGPRLFEQRPLSQAFSSIFQSTAEPTSVMGRFLDRAEAFHPIDHDAKRQAHIAHLTMVLRLFRAREQARGQ